MEVAFSENVGGTRFWEKTRSSISQRLLSVSLDIQEIIVLAVSQQARRGVLG